MLVPVEYDEDGHILDGHHRAAIAAELGLDNFPRVIRSGLGDRDAKTEHAVVVNAARRHMRAEDKRTLVGNLRARGWSTTRISAATGIPRASVGRYVQHLVSTGTTFPEVVEGADGRTFRATRPRTSPVVHSFDEQAQARAALTRTEPSEVWGRMDLLLRTDDDYLTPDQPVRALLRHIRPGRRVLAPFDLPDSAFVRLFREAGHEVTASHLRTGQDFFAYSNAELAEYSLVASNPPFSRRTDVMSRLFEAGVPFALLLGVAGLMEGPRFDLLANNPHEVLYLDRRVSYLREGGDRPVGSPPFGSAFLCSQVLPERLVYERLGS